MIILNPDYQEAISNGYIAIYKRSDKGRYQHWVGSDKCYEYFDSFCNFTNSKIYAELFNLTEKEVDYLTGYAIKKGKSRSEPINPEKDLIEIGEHYLEDLVKELNNKNNFDPQATLDLLHRVTRKKIEFGR